MISGRQSRDKMKFKTATELNIDSLFHYTSFTRPERLARVFTEKSIYCSNPKNFNDPWDCRPCFNKEVLKDPKEYDRIVNWFMQCERKINPSLPEEEHLHREQELKSNYSLLESLIDQVTSGMEEAIQSQYRVFCMSIHPHSHLMWSHYGDKHQGVCLEFSVKNSLFCGALKIQYIKKYPIFKLYEQNKFENIKPLISKSIIWRYENEFRLITSELPYTFPNTPSSENGFVSLPNNALKSVILGCQMTDANKDIVRSLILNSGFNVELKEARIIQNRYELEIHHLKI